MELFEEFGRKETIEFLKAKAKVEVKLLIQYLEKWGAGFLLQRSSNFKRMSLSISERLDYWYFLKHSLGEKDCYALTAPS